MSASPRITAVIPTYRRKDLLRRTLESVRAQTVRDLKIGVTDNASTPESCPILGATP